MPANANDPRTTGHESTRAPSRQPMPGVEDAPIDAGATKDTRLPTEENPVRPQRISREAAEKGIAPDPDPDDPVSL